MHEYAEIFFITFTVLTVLVSPVVILGQCWATANMMSAFNIIDITSAQNMAMIEGEKSDDHAVWDSIDFQCKQNWEICRRINNRTIHGMYEHV